ncbi:MAG: hypothetical protein HYS81_05470 [Candidatus Aenigmatarchaeota archaeon]|nr:MAG: hypothetical protein HYS81_05470 [Candidatus Aenigmarchaeota archaeon]
MTHDIDLERDVLECVLVKSMDGDRLHFLGPRKLVLGQFASGVLSHVGKPMEGFDYYEYGTNHRASKFYETTLWKHFERGLKKIGSGMESRIGNAAMGLVQPHGREYYGQPESASWHETDLYNIFEVSPHMTTFSLTYELVHRVESKTWPKFAQREKLDMQGIGKCMRGFIERDIQRWTEGLEERRRENIKRLQ